MVKESIFDLIEYYKEHLLQGKKITKKKEKDIGKNILKLLQEGYTSSGIKNAINHGDLSGQLFLGIPENLLNPDEFYYHNELRIVSKAPIIYLDYNTGTIIREIEENFLELIASYTLDDLTNYYCRQMRLPEQKIRQNYKRYKGILKWILKNNDVEIALFMIDSAANEVFSEGLEIPKDPMSIIDHRDKAEDALNNKITEARMSGDDKIIPRKRNVSS